MIKVDRFHRHQESLDVDPIQNPIQNPTQDPIQDPIQELKLILIRGNFIPPPYPDLKLAVSTAARSRWTLIRRRHQLRNGINHCDSASIRQLSDAPASLSIAYFSYGSIDERRPIH